MYNVYYTISMKRAKLKLVFRNFIFPMSCGALDYYLIYTNSELTLSFLGFIFFWQMSGDKKSFRLYIFGFFLYFILQIVGYFLLSFFHNFHFLPSITKGKFKSQIVFLIIKNFVLLMHNDIPFIFITSYRLKKKLLKEKKLVPYSLLGMIVSNFILYEIMRYFLGSYYYLFDSINFSFEYLNGLHKTILVLFKYPRLPLYMMINKYKSASYFNQIQRAVFFLILSSTNKINFVSNLEKEEIYMTKINSITFLPLILSVLMLIINVYYFNNVFIAALWINIVFILLSYLQFLGGNIIFFEMFKGFESFLGLYIFVIALSTTLWSNFDLGLFFFTDMFPIFVLIYKWYYNKDSSNKELLN